MMHHTPITDAGGVLPMRVLGSPRAHRQAARERALERALDQLHDDLWQPTRLTGRRDTAAVA